MDADRSLINSDENYSAGTLNIKDFTAALYNNSKPKITFGSPEDNLPQHVSIVDYYFEATSTNEPSTKSDFGNQEWLRSNRYHTTSDYNNDRVNKMNFSCLSHQMENNHILGPNFEAKESLEEERSFCEPPLFYNNISRDPVFEISPQASRQYDNEGRSLKLDRFPSNEKYFTPSDHATIPEIVNNCKIEDSMHGKFPHELDGNTIQKHSIDLLQDYPIGAGNARMYNGGNGSQIPFLYHKRPRSPISPINYR